MSGFKGALVVITGAMYGFLATSALGAGVWSGRVVIEKIVVRSDRPIAVVSQSGDWPNPDSCDNSSKAFLLPPTTEGGVLAYDQIYAALLEAALNDGQAISVLLDGCTVIGIETFPIIKSVAIIN